MDKNSSFHKQGSEGKRTVLEKKWNLQLVCYFDYRALGYSVLWLYGQLGNLVALNVPSITSSILRKKMFLFNISTMHDYMKYMKRFSISDTAYQC